MLSRPNGRAMAASVCARQNPDLAGFVLDKDHKGLPEKYRIYLTQFWGPMARFVGLSPRMSLMLRILGRHLRGPADWEWLATAGHN